jgi:LacI family transcriptional regulator
VITRKSSDILAVEHKGVARALHFINERFAGSISVDDVARAAGMSRRGLHQAFCEHIGCTPGDKIRDVRLDSARRRLAKPTTRLRRSRARAAIPT